MAGGGGEADQGLGNTPHPLSQVAPTWNSILFWLFTRIFIPSISCSSSRAILPECVHHWRNILSCTAKTSKHLIKNNIGQFICILWPSFDHKNIFDKLNRFLRYRHIKMRQWWNAEFHRFCILIWWYLKNIFSLSRTFCWAKLGQSVWLNCPIFLLAKCLLVSAMQDKMWQKKWKLLRENCPVAKIISIIYG